MLSALQKISTFKTKHKVSTLPVTLQKNLICRGWKWKTMFNWNEMISHEWPIVVEESKTCISLLSKARFIAYFIWRKLHQRMCCTLLYLVVNVLDPWLHTSTSWMDWFRRTRQVSRETIYSGLYDAISPRLLEKREKHMPTKWTQQGQKRQIQEYSR